MDEARKHMTIKRGLFQAPEVLVLLAVLGSLGAFFSLNLGPNSGPLFFLDLLLAILLTLVFLGSRTNLGFDLFRGLFEFALGLTEAASELGDLGATEQKESYGEDSPENWAIEHGKGEVHSRIAVAGIG